MEAKACQSCNMPMTEKEHFGGSDPASPYCVHCTDESGNLRPYEEILDGFTNWLTTNEGCSPEEGRKKAAAIMDELPAWKDRAGGSCCSH